MRRESMMRSDTVLSNAPQQLSAVPDTTGDASLKLREEDAVESVSGSRKLRKRERTSYTAYAEEEDDFVSLDESEDDDPVPRDSLRSSKQAREPRPKEQEESDEWYQRQARMTIESLGAHPNDHEAVVQRTGRTPGKNMRLTPESPIF